MSNPSFDNIDKWLFEYTEGNLSSSQETQLKQFLLQNPEFEADLDAWQDAFVDASPVIFPNTDSYTRKPFAWWVPAAAFSTLVISGFLGWMSFPNLNESNILADSAHKSISFELFKNAEKTGTYFEYKKQKYSFDPNFISFQQLNPIYNSNSPFYHPSEFILNQSDFNSSFGNFYNGISEVTPLEKQSIDQSNESSGNLTSSLGSNKEKNNITNQNISSTETAEPVVKDEDQSALNARAMSRTENKFSSTYNKSFSSKLKSIARKIVRMTDNPIALSNSKDIYYHTPGMQSLDVNFGSVGSLLTPRLQTITRAQWTGRDNQQFSNQLSFDTYVKSIRGGIGVQLNHVYYGGGAYQIGQFALMYSPKITVSKNVVLEPAIRFKMGNKTLRNQKMIPGQLVELDRQNARMYNGENIQSKTQELWYKDIGFALMTNTKWFSAGVQIDNVGRHYNNVYNSNGENDRQGYHFTTTVGTDYVSRTKIFSFSPYIMYQKVENLSEIWGGSIFRYKKLTMGGGFSSHGDYAGSIGIKTNRLMITYAIDNTQSAILNKKLLSQQLTLRLLTNRNRKDYRMLNL